MKKKLIIFAAAVICLASCDLPVNSIEAAAINKPRKMSVPEALLTPANRYWTAPAINSDSVPNNTRPVLQKVKIENDGSFTFHYDRAEIKGTVEFAKNSAGKNILVTAAKKGVGINGKKISADELYVTYSDTYLWERINFPGIPSEDFLLLVNLSRHPQAGSNGRIDKEWVTKFSIR